MLWTGVYALVQRAKTGDQDAWRELYGLAGTYIARLALRYQESGWAYRSASDAAAVTWSRAWDDVQTGALFRAWLTKIVRSVCTSDLRHDLAPTNHPPGGVSSLNGADTGDSSSAFGDVAAADPTPSYWVGMSEQQSVVADAVARLDPTDMAIVQLHFFEDRPLAWIAEQMGMTYDRRVAYMGAMDDASRADGVKTRHLEAAVQAVLKGEKPAVAETLARGCQIRYARTRR
jgi:DNA-directed RNA polymerase specialized sigma24 family protein